VPSTWPASETLKLNPDGVLFSNGPGDPSAVPYAVETVKNIIGKVPVFGICMGHQLLGQALGGTTYKMKFGHHGGNHPVRNLRTGRVEISSQVWKTILFCTYLSSFHRNHGNYLNPFEFIWSDEGGKNTHCSLVDIYFLLHRRVRTWSLVLRRKES
jgi:anthranilate/para-aminobenzoate synthase component II